MGYRGETAGDAVEAPTASGVLRLVIEPRVIRLSLGQRSLHIADEIATLVEHGKSKDDSYPYPLSGPLVIARDVPRDDLGIWVEVPPRGKRPAGMKRIFGVEPLSLLERDGLAALQVLDSLVHRLRAATAQMTGGVRRAIEMGSAKSNGIDKVLLVDHGDRFAVFSRALFRDRAKLACTVHDDGRVEVMTSKGTATVTVKSKFGVTVLGDYIRFADRHGNDVVRVSMPWIEPEDRRELARRIGQLVDR